ncbi:MAG: hypothetical protein M3137_02020 [Actinomycetota bacterium]|nr:hypothetical protein [Actinomycetota bacterium]
MSGWYSIEVLDGTTSASVWADAYGDALVEAALAHGAQDWLRHRHGWGVVFEFALSDDASWEAFQRAVAVRSALDAVPDPLTGLIVYRGRGGSAGASEPRRPRPMIGSGSAALPIPWDLGLDDLLTSFPLTTPAAIPALVVNRH